MVALCAHRRYRGGGCRPGAGRINRRLYDQLARFVQAHRLGTVAQPDEVYDFENGGQKDTGLLPDIGFYYAWREPLVDPDKPYPFAPDLAVEVASPSQSRRAMQAKAARYLRGGTAVVWVIWPKRRQVDVWHPGGGEPTVLGSGDALDGEDVIPGFTYPVDELFA
ncbi:MAG TPA: Uma2 family endonuclease [Chloroflexota bacterium]|nr:Uma2 family endonuclease [Chloroflexota bacterium]